MAVEVHKNMSVICIYDYQPSLFDKPLQNYSKVN